MSRIKKIVAQHCAMPNKAGGPASGLQLLRNSSLMNQRYALPLIPQNEAAGGLNLRLIFRMAQMIRKVKPNLLHVRGLQNEGFHGVLAGRLARCPKIVLSIHGSVSESSKTGKLRRFIFSKIIEPLTLSLSDGFYCVCYSQAKRLGLYKKQKFLGIIHNAAPPFRVVEQHEKEELRKELLLESEDIVGIYVGRLTQEKGLGYLAKALKLIWESPNPIKMKFLMVGEGPAQKELQQLLGEYESSKILRFLGARTDIDKLLAVSDIFVFPTLHENLSNALLEACNAQLGIIATEVGGNPEVIENGKEGILVPPANVQRLAEGIKLLVEDKDLRLKLGYNAKIKIERDFNINSVMENISTIYETLIN